MKRPKFSEEQVVCALRQVEAGSPVGDICRQLGVSEATLQLARSPDAERVRRTTPGKAGRRRSRLL